MTPTPMITAGVRTVASADVHVSGWVLAAALVLAVIGLLLYWRRERIAHETVETPPPARRH